MQLEPTIADRLISLLGLENVELESEALQDECQNSVASHRKIRGKLTLTHVSQIPKLLEIANVNQLKLYPISKGNNWGYGGKTPSDHSCFVVDLGKLNKIIEVNTELGYVRLEPGVTQGQLYEYFEAHSIPLMVPTTGAGPNASLLGNALEKGYGITPVEDHFGGLIALRAYLGNGQHYESTLSALGGKQSDKAFKWKIGPYLDGLFTQSNLGIVYEATLALAKKPPVVNQFVVFFEDTDLEAAVEATRKIKQRLGSLVGGINLIHARRTLAMIESPPYGEGVHSDEEIQRISKKRNVKEWMMTGGLYGDKALVKCAKSILLSEVQSFSQRTLFFSKRTQQWLLKILKYLPFQNLRKSIESLGGSLDILEGKPSEVALPLSYLKNQNRPKSDFNPDRDGSGLIWYAPLIPLSPRLIREYTKMVKRVCFKHNVDPMITLTGISERCFDSTIPILFQKSSAQKTQAAHACLDELIASGIELGVFPYRLDIDHMHLFDSSGTPFEMIQKINKVLDPNNVISPLRYCGKRKA